MTYCERCGTPVVPGAERCPGCGTEIAVAAPTPSVPVSPRESIAAAPPPVPVSADVQPATARKPDLHAPPQVSAAGRVPAPRSTGGNPGTRKLLVLVCCIILALCLAVLVVYRTLRGPAPVPSRGSTAGVSDSLSPSDGTSTEFFQEGTVTWYGEANREALLVLEGGAANYGRVTGALPGTPYTITVRPRDVEIEEAPGQDNHFGRIVLRLPRSGRMEVVISWKMLRGTAGVPAESRGGQK